MVERFTSPSNFGGPDMRRAAGGEMVRYTDWYDANARAETAERQLAERDADLARKDAALFSIAHTFTEDSHGGTKCLPGTEYQAMARAALAGSGDGWPVPDGWKLVPVHLTVEMLHELERGEQDGYRAVWPDVLAASPSTAGER